MMKYCCGFVLSPQTPQNEDFVVLIRKTKPAWQRGLLNGIGGKVELGESYSEAMERECREESGISIPAVDWTCIAVWEGADYTVRFFFARTEDAILAKSMTEEQIEFYDTKDLPRDIIPNCRWLIPLAANWSVSANGKTLQDPVRVFER